MPPRPRPRRRPPEPDAAVAAGGRAGIERGGWRGAVGAGGRRAGSRLPQTARVIAVLSTKPNAAEMSFAAASVNSAARSADTGCEPSR